jgi:CheY-like chemotaxis protein
METVGIRKILMADDDEEDCFLAKEAFKAIGMTPYFSFVADGIELMDSLAELSGSNSNRLPDLILLDLNMPRKDGREALREIKSIPAFQHIPVVILTTSAEEDDMVLSRKAGANTFMTKPATFDEWIGLMKSVAECWL